MSDPLSDPRAADLLSADPGEVWLLASTFRIVAGEAQATAAGLRGAQHDATWTGAAASAFRANLGQLPGELDKVQTSYREVAGALGSYESELATVKPAFQHLAQQLGGARSGLSGAQSQLSSAQGELYTASSAPHATTTTPAVQSAHDAVQTASGAVTRMQAEVSGLESQGFALLDRFQHARDTCSGRVSSACSAAPHQSFWDHMLSDVGNWMSDAGHFFAAVGKGIYHGVIGLPGAVVAFVEHPSWKTFADLAEDVAITASVVLLVTGVGELMLPGEAAAAGFLSAANDIAGTAATEASLAGGGSEVGQAGDDLAHGNVPGAEASFANAGIDFMTAVPGALGAPELGDALPKSIAADDAEETANAVKAYAASRSSGATEVQALRAMDSDERSEVLEAMGLKSGSMLDLSAADRVALLQRLANPESTLESVEKDAKLANIAALPGKSFVNFGVDKLIIDPLSTHDQNEINQLFGVGSGS